MDLEHLKQLVDMANANAKLFAAREASQLEVLKEIINSAEVVVGVWRDPSEPGGVGHHIIKGWRRMAATATEAPPGSVKLTESQNVTVNAVRLANYDEALAAQRVFCPDDWSVVESRLKVPGRDLGT